MKVSIGVSNRHIHLDYDTCVKLFGNSELTIVRELSQGGETSLKEIQQKQQTLLSGQKPLALSEGKQDEVKNK